MPQKSRNNVSDFLRAMPVKDLKLNDDGKAVGEVGEVGIVDETNGFGFDIFEKTEIGCWSAT